MYGYYKIARDRSWQCLIETNVNTLPIELRQILNYYNIKVQLFDDNINEAFTKNNIIHINKNLPKQEEDLLLHTN